MAPRHFVDLWKLEATDLRAILDDARARKAARLGWPKGQPDADRPAEHRTLAMIFEKHSTRTRFSFDAAMRQLGGHTIISNAQDMQLGRGEPIEDTARVLSRMVDAIMVRANVHEDLERLALNADVPVINGLSDRGHPCQIVADLMTIEERLGNVKGKAIAWVGDGNNVCASFIHAAQAFGFKLNIACPPHFHPDLVDLARASQAGAAVQMSDDPTEAVRGADCVVTDTWVSMGDVDLTERLDAFEPYQVDEVLMSEASPSAIFLHCLPAHRGEEVTADVIDGHQSAVWQQAANRLPTEQALIYALVTGDWTGREHAR